MKESRGAWRQRPSQTFLPWEFLLANIGRRITNTFKCFNYRESIQMFRFPDKFAWKWVFRVSYCSWKCFPLGLWRTPVAGERDVTRRELLPLENLEELGAEQDDDENIFVLYVSYIYLERLFETLNQLNQTGYKRSSQYSAHRDFCW